MVRKNNNHFFKEELEQFVQRIDSLKTTMPLMMETLLNALNQEVKNFQSFCDKNKIKKVTNKDDSITYIVKSENVHEIRRLLLKITNASLAFSFIPRTMIVSLVSLYDAFLGELLRIIFKIIPEILNSSERQLSFSQLANFGSIEEAKDFIVEKEIESVIRENHEEQIKWLEKKLKIELRKGLDIWPCFLEVTERRNLFVHTNGIVSNQYLNKCRENKIKLAKDVTIGKQLYVGPEYFKKGCDCIFEMGVKLAHVLWRKLAPSDIENADINLNSLCYDLIFKGNYELALILLNFATLTLKKHSSEGIYLFLLLNKAQTLKWLGKEDECKKLLKLQDWSAKGYQFNLVKHVLLEDFKRAAEIMICIGKDGEVKKIDYKEWPIFKEFRKTKIFLSAYEKIFGEKFVFEEKGILKSDLNVNKELNDSETPRPHQGGAS